MHVKRDNSAPGSVHLLLLLLLLLPPANKKEKKKKKKSTRVLFFFFPPSFIQTNTCASSQVTNRSFTSRKHMEHIRSGDTTNLSSHPKSNKRSKHIACSFSPSLYIEVVHFRLLVSCRIYLLKIRKKRKYTYIHQRHTHETNKTKPST